MVAINVIQGNDNMFDVAVHGHYQPDYNYLYGQLEQLKNIVSHSAQNQVTSYFNEYIQKAASMIDRYKQELNQVLNNNQLRESLSSTDPYAISALHDFTQIQQANLINQRYILAYPDLRAKYNNLRCYGYADTYIDLDPNTVKHEHYDYRQATDGILDIDHLDGDEENDAWVIHFYTEDGTYDDLDRKLSTMDKFDILKTWDSLKTILDYGIDPTDPDSDID